MAKNHPSKELTLGKKKGGALSLAKTFGFHVWEGLVSVATFRSWSYSADYKHIEKALRTGKRPSLNGFSTSFCMVMTTILPASLAGSTSLMAGITLGGPLGMVIAVGGLVGLPALAIMQVVRGVSGRYEQDIIRRIKTKQEKRQARLSQRSQQLLKKPVGL